MLEYLTDHYLLGTFFKVVISMKKFKLDNDYFKKALYVLFVIICAISFEKLLSHFDVIYFNAASFFKSVRSILSPFIYGFFIAYLINPLVRTVEKYLKKIKLFGNRPKPARIIAAFFSFAIIIGALIWIISYLLPEVTESVAAVFNSIKNIDFSKTDNVFFTETLPGIYEAFGLHYSYKELIDMVFQPLMQVMSNLPTLFNKLLAGTLNAAGVLLNFVLGIMIAFYMTLEKESFKRFAIKFLKLIFKKDTAERIINIATDSNVMFEKFFSGKAIDSLIIGLLFYIISQFILKLKFSLLFSLIVGVTNMIPYFGPFMGGIPVALLVFLGSPTQGLWTGLAIFLLQQFDGIILGPKILGDSTGLKPIDVIFAIIVGGAVSGVLGMFLGVPIFAVIKTMLNALINKRYDRKYMAAETDGRAPDGKDG